MIDERHILLIDDNENGSQVTDNLKMTPLGSEDIGFRGSINAIDTSKGGEGLTPEELERRLIELGFIEGAKVEILHQGIIGGDPIAVRVDNATVALRRREAMAILVE